MILVVKRVMLGNNLPLFYAAFSSALSDHLSICSSFFLFDTEIGNSA